ncbi:MAG: hypothetical protein ACREEM_40165, partial [Blastocatellia bacterium]
MTFSYALTESALFHLAISVSVNVFSNFAYSGLDRRFGQLQKNVCQKDKRCHLSDNHLSVCRVWVAETTIKA